MTEVECRMRTMQIYFDNSDNGNRKDELFNRKTEYEQANLCCDYCEKESTIIYSSARSFLYPSALARSLAPHFSVTIWVSLV